ncbi:MAG: hypothetical protein K6G60_02885 [Lachnospiraceae bacterium]|nr:hypothetical protein [Lachnospiraceae bacterium]
MDKEKISEALSYLDDDIIKETDALRQKSAKRRSFGIINIAGRPWVKIGLTAAACVLIIIGGGVAVYRSGILSRKKSAPLPDLASSKFAYTSSDGITQGLSEGDGFATDRYDTSDSGRNEGTRENAVGTSPASVGEKQVAAAAMPYDMTYITSFCTYTCKDSKVAGSYGFDLSENADYYVVTGDRWELEFLNSDTWEKVAPKEEKAWPAIAIPIGQYAGTNHYSSNFNLDCYGELKDGSYRIVKKIWIHKVVGGNDTSYEESVYCDLEIKK